MPPAVPKFQTVLGLCFCINLAAVNAALILPTPVKNTLSHLAILGASLSSAINIKSFIDLLP